MPEALTFLKKLGTILANAAGIFAGIGPIITPFLGSAASQASSAIGTAVNDLTAISQVVVQVEAVLQAPGSGPQKLIAATPLVIQILKTSQIVAGKQIADEALFAKAAQEITSGVADLLNSIHPDEAKHAA